MSACGHIRRCPRQDRFPRTYGNKRLLRLSYYNPSCPEQGTALPFRQACRRLLPRPPTHWYEIFLSSKEERRKLS